MKTGVLPTQSDPLAAAEAFLKGLLERDLVDEVLVPARSAGGTTALGLFADPARLEGANPWSPVMPVQGARAVSNLTFTDPGRRVAVVLRPCEARAAVELIKLQQIQPERVVFVTVDCPGTFEVTGFAAAGLDPAEVSRGLVAAMAGGAPAAPEGLAFRTACTVCEHPDAAWGQVRLLAWGAADGAVAVEAEDDWADRLAEAGLATFPAEAPAGRASVLSQVQASRTKARDELFERFRAEARGIEGLKEAFATCIRCYNCMENCPICYCKQCIFKSPTFDHPGELYARWAERKGAQRMPAETLLFHLTRLNHMATSCIGCGLCDTACPMGLPVATLFRSVAQKVQAMLEYEPGRSLDDPIPLVVFREDELQEESGAGE
ncbi:4Fe-4S dicluster domain-containing protein [Deferrisoma sp.]